MRVIEDFILEMRARDMIIERIIKPTNGFIKNYLNENNGEIEEILVVKKLKGG